MKFLKIQAYGTETWITNVDSDLIDETISQDELKFLTKEQQDELGAEFGDKISNFDLSSADYVTTLTEGVISLDSLDDNELYFDSFTDEFYTAEDIRDWDKTNVIYRHDGSNYTTTDILAEVEIADEDMVEIDTVNYNTGRKEIFEVNGKRLEIDYSLYQGSWDTVEVGEDILEELV